MRRSLSIALAAAALVAWEGRASADDVAPLAAPPPTATEAAPTAPAAPAPAAPSAAPSDPSTSSPARAVPDYDGRGEEPATVGDAALWVPRVLLFPFYVVSEYLVRRPLAWVITTAERKQWASVVKDFFLFGEEKKIGVVPTAFIDFGFRASVGLYAFWDDFLGSGHDLRFHGSTFGLDWLQGTVADRIWLDKDKSSRVDLRVDASHRPDQLFGGIGPRTLDRDRTRYGVDRIQGGPVFDVTYWRGSRFRALSGLRYASFRDASCCDDPSLVSRAAEGKATLPPGFAGYTAGFQRAELTVDTRKPRPEPQTGLRLELESELAADVTRSQSTWVRYGGTAGAFADLTGHQRTVSLSVSLLFADPLGREPVPFTELVQLGGGGLMRAYLSGRLMDRSAAVSTLKYRWPIWAGLDGTIQVATGNVFGAGLKDFDWNLLRLSSAVGIETIGSPDHTFEVLTGLGTETFADGTKISSVRLVFGTNRGF